MLPDESLLEIFDLYREETILSHVQAVWGWTTLAHVCQRWRAIILASPQLLHLRVTCSPRTPVKTSLDIWPPFPLAVICVTVETVNEKGEENIAAALEHRDRISDLHIFDNRGSSLKRWVVAMQEPLPVLADLYLGTFHGESAVVLPDEFLGGSAPCLRSFLLQRVAFPAFPKFVLRATHIVLLSLYEIQDSWYTSVPPEAMATCLAALPDLETFRISFLSPPSSPLQITPPSRMRSVLPALTTFEFKGVSEYLEGFIARIDIPHLNRLHMVFFMDLIFDTPQLHRFIDRTGSLRPFNPALLKISRDVIGITFGSSLTYFGLEIECEEPDLQISSVTQVCNEHFPLLSRVEQLDICETPSMELVGKNEVNSSLWLELFRRFSAVRSLYVSETLEPLVAAALGELTGERTMEVLPALENLSLDGAEPSESTRDTMESFIAARQLSDRPVVVQRRKARPQPTLNALYPSEDEL